MKKKLLLFYLLVPCLFFAQRPKPDILANDDGDITIQPIYHGTLVIQWKDKTIYIDPYGEAKRFEGLASPDLILITDIHADHLNDETLDALDTEKAKFIVPSAVYNKLKTKYQKKAKILKNGDFHAEGDILINAIPMYNTTDDRLTRHPKGRGNGYFLNIGGKAIYISGDTEDINEMRSLQNIDVAFVCMNLPYTMDINQAAKAVLAFKPRIIYPYHYRGKPKTSNTYNFKKIINKDNPEIEVRLRNWYLK